MSIFNGTAKNDNIVGAATGYEIYDLERNDRLVADSESDIVDFDEGYNFLLGQGGEALISIDIGDETNVGYAEIPENQQYESRFANMWNIESEAVIEEPALNLIMGTPEVDIINGTDQNDLIYALESDDIINGGAGNDTLYGDDGDDTINGGDGDDTMIGGLGADTFDGGDGIDTVDYSDATMIGDSVGVYIHLGGATKTSYSPESNGDILSNVERVIGSDYNDTIYGTNATNDTIYGGDGGDSINAGGGYDTIYGGDGGDVINAGDGDDIVNAGAGNDIVYGKGGADTMDGGDGNDLLRYDESDAAINVNLATNTASGGYATGDVISNFESVIGSAYNDTLTGNDGNNYIQGRIGADTLTGGGGNDIFGYINASPQNHSISSAYDTIADFTQGEDIMLFEGSVFGTDWTAFSFDTSSGTETVITHATLSNRSGWNDFELHLDGVHNLVASDFTFVADFNAVIDLM